jgi:hypothetical protein
VPTELGKNKELVDIIYIVEETLFSFIPVFGVTIACTIIVFVVIRSSRQRTKMTQWMNKKQSNEMSVTKTLLSVITEFTRSGTYVMAIATSYMLLEYL